MEDCICGFTEEMAIKLSDFINFATGFLQLIIVVIVLVALYKLLNIFF
ncbi:MAG: hypothetical protein FWG70_01065 [Oscillospiraceae bacterium]|nr:hypothetical protein [Oscillospiraceae bacterium]